MNLPEIPEDQKAVPWIQSFTDLFLEQARVIQAQVEEIAKLKVTIQELQDELARLKKTPPKPKFRPQNGASNGKGGKSESSNSSNANRNACKPKIKEEIILKPANLPEGSRFKGFSTYKIQELVVTAKDIVYKIEVWQAPDGSIIRAELPAGTEGSHYGPDLRALIHSLYANGMTQPVIFEFVRNVGIEVSEGQIHNILMNEALEYEKQSQAILAAGLQEAPYIRVDDTGAKHQHKRGYCTHIGGEYFAYYKTTASKSRLNFLKILSQGKEGYIINEAFIWHLFRTGVEDDILNAFEAYKGRCYQGRKGLNRLLNEMNLFEKKLRLTCFEAGLIGFIQETILKPGQVLLSDRAGQFCIFDHAGCWIHMERPLRKIIASTPEIEAEIEKVRDAIWALYEELIEASRTQKNKEQVKTNYSALVEMVVVSPGVRAVLDAFKANREEMLKALDHPGLPLHNNDSERDIRSMVKFRKVSGSTKSEEGRAFRDGIMTLKQTCFRLGENFWDYMRSWFRGSAIDLAA